MSLPTDLGANDVGFLLHVVDFSHLVRWNGITWEWAPGDEGNGFIRDYLVQPPVAGWQLCDGSVTSLLIVGHTTLYAQTITTPNETSGTYHKSAATTDGTVQAAVAPSVSGSTASENGHTHDVDPPSTASGGPSATTTVDNTGGGSTVAVGSATHTHDTNVASFTSGAGSAHSHGAGSLAVSASGEPAHINVLRYFRR
jgi:hypothetical protein